MKRSFPQQRPRALTNDALARVDLSGVKGQSAKNKSVGSSRVHEPITSRARASYRVERGGEAQHRHRHHQRLQQHRQQQQHAEPRPGARHPRAGTDPRPAAGREQWHRADCRTYTRRGGGGRREGGRERGGGRTTNSPSLSSSWRDSGSIEEEGGTQMSSWETPCVSEDRPVSPITTLQRVPQRTGLLWGTRLLWDSSGGHVHAGHGS